MDESGTTQPRHTRQNLSMNEKITRHSKGKTSTVGDRHDQYHRPTSTREADDSVKHYNLDH